MPRNILLGSSRSGPVAGLRRQPHTFKLPRSQITPTLTNPTPSSTPNPTPPTNHIPSTNPSPTPIPTLTSDSISITNAIPVVFRHIKHLETCVNYILEQTLLPNEIIIIISEYIDNEDNKKIIAFSQKMFMYKINLQNIDESNWIGSKMTKKKNIITMQNLRNLKFKKYPFWRIDKYNLQTINGGWHFSFLQTPEQILNKIKSFSHGEFNINNISEKIIEEKILKNEDIFGRGITLKKTLIDSSYPNYILENKEKFSKWII